MMEDDETAEDRMQSAIYSCFILFGIAGAVLGGCVLAIIAIVRHLP